MAAEAHPGHPVCCSAAQKSAAADAWPEGLLWAGRVSAWCSLISMFSHLHLECRSRSLTLSEQLNADTSAPGRVCCTGVAGGT